MLAADDIVVDEKSVIPFDGFGGFSVENLIAVFGLANLTQWQVARLGDDLYILKRVGVREGNPNA